MALTIIVAISQLKPKVGDTGTLECPKCSGRFHWSFHGAMAMRGACETGGCLTFMS